MEQEAFLHSRDSLDSSPPPPSPTSGEVGSHVHFRHVFLCIFALKLLTQLNFALLELPLVQLAEDLVCRSLVGSDHHNITEVHCKSENVQNTTAHIVGLKTTFDALPCIMTAWLYGWISDSWGRKPVLFFSIIGQLLTLTSIMIIGFFLHSPSARLLWLPSVWLLAGGGTRVEMAMQYTALCDATSWKERTSLLSFLHASDGAGALLGYALSSALMKGSLWVPFGAAITILIAKCFLLRYTPETAPAHSKLGIDVVLLRYNPASTTESMQRTTIPHIPNTYARVWAVLQVRLRNLQTLFKHVGVSIVFAGFVIKRVSFSSLTFVFQYASEILKQELSATLLLRIIHQLSVAVLFIFLLPLLTRTLESPRKDVWVVRSSLVVLMIGFFFFRGARSLLDFSLGLGICGLGEGLEVGLQSLGSYLVGEANHAAFFSTASLLGVFGELVGGPLMAGAYTFRDHDQRPLGYCFLISVGVFGCLLAGSLLLKISRV